MKQAFLILFISLFVTSSFAIEPIEVRNLETEKKVIITLDGQFPEPGRAKDVLFVVDDSGSMNQHQQKLADYVGEFVTAAESSKGDYQIGVVGTSMKGLFYQPGELLGQVPIVTSKTPDLAQTLYDNLLIGDNGDATEEMFSPVVTALSEPMINGQNQGFLREKADLALVFLTDSDDQSTLSVDDFSQALIDLKKSKNSVIVQSIVANIESSNSCNSGEPFPTKIIELTDFFSGNVYNLCAPNFKAHASSIGDKIFNGIPGNFRPGVDINNLELVGRPVAGTIEVKFGTQTLPEDALVGWTYIQTRNVIQFGADIDWQVQNNNPEIVISYKVQ